MRDSLNALTEKWGEDRLSAWLSQSPQRILIENIRREPLGPAGFSLLIHRIMEPTRAEIVSEFLRELGERVSQPTSISIGGSIALILPGLLSRRTEDINVVDEVPVQIRGDHALLEALSRRYSIRLAHFQSHYLPAGWESRLHSLDTFGQLHVRLVDAGDIFLGKLFSNREKDLDDLRVLASLMDKNELVARLPTAAVLRAEERLRKNAEQNWYIVYGEALPG